MQRHKNLNKSKEIVYYIKADRITLVIVLRDKGVMKNYSMKMASDYGDFMAKQN